MPFWQSISKITLSKAIQLLKQSFIINGIFAIDKGYVTMIIEMNEEPMIKGMIFIHIPEYNRDSYILEVIGQRNTPELTLDIAIHRSAIDDNRIRHFYTKADNEFNEYLHQLFSIYKNENPFIFTEDVFVRFPALLWLKNIERFS